MMADWPNPRCRTGCCNACKNLKKRRQTHPADLEGPRQASRASAGTSAERSPTERDPIGFDPYQTTKWRNVVGPAPGYLPKTQMRMGSAGFYIHCKACNAEFESKGWAYCPTCMELPAEERHAMKPAFVGRMCQAPGCENPIPHIARAGTMYCSSHAGSVRRVRQITCTTPR
jgi:hypothetical protein